MSETEAQTPETPEKERTVSESSEAECDIHFPPVVTLPEVQVSTNEENETEFFRMRAKLYRFDKSADPPEWKERGTGDLKLLKHTKTSSFRIVMRRDKTLKVCANHFVTPMMKLKKYKDNEKAFVYTVMADFADEVAKPECLAVKFGNANNAALFKDKFEEAQKILESDCELYNGVVDQKIVDEIQKLQNDTDESSADDSDPEEQEVTKKLSELNVKQEEA